MENKSYLGAVSTAGTTRQARDFPIATYSLVLLNLLLFIGALPGDRVDLANRYGLIPQRPEILQFFTTIFLHFDLVHLTVNVVFLWLFGRKVEKTIGPLVFLMFYIGSGFVASSLHWAIVGAFMSPAMSKVPVVGASGAIAGVLGMYAVRFGREKISIWHFEVPALYLLLTWLLIQATFGVAGIFSETLGPIDLHNIGYWSHIGGFIFGMTAAWATTRRDSAADESRTERKLRGLRKKTLLDVASRFQTLKDADPSDPFAYAELGRTYAFLTDQIRSTDYYLRATDLYRRAGKREDALACIWEALHFWPETVLTHEAMFRLACCLEMLGESQAAAGHFRRLADVAQGDPEGEMSLLKIAQIELDRLHHPAKAEEAIERMIKDYPNSQWMDIAEDILKRAHSSSGA
jgi:membrane associated rhomboid family serine protease